MPNIYPYRFNKQFETYIRQFMRIFSGFQYVSDNAGTLERIPVVFGPMSRVVAARVNKDNSNFTSKKIPVIAISLSGLQRNAERQQPVDAATHRVASRNGTRHSLGRVNGPTYSVTMDVNILASSISQMFEISEQIFLLFNPRTVLQVSDSPDNDGYITSVNFDNMTPNINYPLGTDNRVVNMELQFSFDARINYPHVYDDDIIEKVKTNMKEEGDDEDVEMDSFEAEDDL